MKQNMGFILAFTAMLVTIMVLHGCTQLSKGDEDTRHVTVMMRSSDDECYMEVNGDSRKEVSDDTLSLDHPLKGKGS